MLKNKVVLSSVLPEALKLNRMQFVIFVTKILTGPSNI